MKILLICSLILIWNTSFGKARDFSTTRLMSTADAGVGSILFHEASLLNPASIAFFEYSSLYYQQGSSKLMNESDNRDTNFDNGTNETFIISDTSSALNGTFSFNHLKQNNIRTKRYASSLASPLAENSAIGIILSYIDTTQVDPDKRLSSEVKTTLGYSLVYSKKVTFGLVYTDAARADKDDQFFIGGFQLEVSDNFHLLLDAGFNPNYAVESKSLHSFAAQINFVSDFFLRAGQFYNNSTKLKGYAWGLSWVGPKLSLDYAFRNSEATTGTGSLLLSEEELHEHSFAMSVRF